MERQVPRSYLCREATWRFAAATAGSLLTTLADW
jgi:hypothetical protein